MKRGPGDEGSEGRMRSETQRMSPVLTQALSHPIRREALRLLHRSAEPKSAAQLSLGIATANASYHLKVLASLGAVEQVGERRARGAQEQCFASEAADHRQVLAILAETEASDHATRR